jgi:colanic acid biosynthesis glycosyl transferase WcaI
VKRTIVFVEQYFYPDGWGGAQLPRDLAAHLARSGYDVEVICGSDQYAAVEGAAPEDPRTAGVRIRRVPSLFGGPIHRLKLLRQLWFYVGVVPLLLLRRRPALLIQQTNPPLSVVFGSFAARLWRRPQIIIAMDLYPEVLFAARALEPSGFLARILAAMFRWSYRTAVRVVSLGPVMSERLAAKGIDPAKIAVIPNWSTGSNGIVRGAANRLASEWNLTGKFVVLYSGNLGIGHEFETFLSGFKQACDVVPEMFLVVIGKGSRLAECKAQVTSLGLDARVRFSDFVPADRMPESIGLADLALVTLRDGFEGIIVPSKLYGYLSRGVPVLYVGPRSDIALAIEQAGCGVVAHAGQHAQVAQGLIALRQDPAFLRQLGEAGRNAYDAGLTARHALARYESLVANVLGSGG